MLRVLRGLCLLSKLTTRWRKCLFVLCWFGTPSSHAQIIRLLGALLTSVRILTHCINAERIKDAVEATGSSSSPAWHGSLLTPIFRGDKTHLRHHQNLDATAIAKAFLNFLWI